MQFLHNFGLTHTDLKLENVLFASNEERISIRNDYGETMYVPNTQHIEGLPLNPNCM